MIYIYVYIHIIYVCVYLDCVELLHVVSTVVGEIERQFLCADANGDGKLDGIEMRPSVSPSACIHVYKNMRGSGLLSDDDMKSDQLR